MKKSHYKIIQSSENITIPMNKVGLLFPLNISMKQNAVIISHDQATLEKICKKFGLRGGYVQIVNSERAVMKATASLDAGQIYYYIPPVKPRSLFSELFGTPVPLEYPELTSLMS